jgi:hypothetical protein
MKSVVVLVLSSVAGASLLCAGAARASCTATVNCEVTVIQCSGQSVCHSGANRVQCDSQTTVYCPVCQAQTTCCDGSLIYCNGYSTCQEFPGTKVVCDGRLGGRCLECPNWGAEALPPWMMDDALSSKSSTCG